MRILVTDGSYKHTLGIVRDLAPHHQVLVAAERRAAMSLHSRYATERLLCPPLSRPEAYVSWLDQVVATYQVDQIMPVGARACELLSHHRHRWSPRTSVVLPSPEQMELALDKNAVYQVAHRVGLPVPMTLRPESLEDLAAAGRAVGYPLVIKAALEGDTGVAYVATAAELEPTFRRYLARYQGKLRELPMLQQRIVGPGFGVFVTYQEGSCKRIMAHRRLRENPPSGGESTCCETVYDAVLFEQGMRLMDAMEWHGVAMVEFKRHDADGRYYLMEINPKFWGSLDLALAAGADFPGDLAAIAQGESLTPVEHRGEGLRLCWPLGSDLLHVLRKPSNWREVVKDWLDPSVRKNLRWRDPLPHVFELAQTAYRWLKA